MSKILWKILSLGGGLVSAFLVLFSLSSPTYAATWIPIPGVNAYENTETIEATLEAGDIAACAGAGDGYWALRFGNGANNYNGSQVSCAVTTASWRPTDFVRDGGGTPPDYGVTITDISVAAYAGGAPNSTLDSDSAPDGVWDWIVPADNTTTTTIEQVSWPAGEAFMVLVIGVCALWLGWRIFKGRL